MSCREKWHAIATGAREKWTRHHRMILGAWVLFVSAVTVVILAKALPPLLWGATYDERRDRRVGPLPAFGAGKEYHRSDVSAANAEIGSYTAGTSLA